MTDAVLLPTQASFRRNREKAEVAAIHYVKSNVPFIVTGGVVPHLQAGYEYEAKIIEERLEQLGIPRSRIMVEKKARNNVENILLSLDMFEGRDLTICSYTGHIARFRRIVDIGKTFGEIRPEINIGALSIGENMSERLYEIFARVLTERAIRNGLKNASVPEGPLKYVANYFMRRF